MNDQERLTVSGIGAIITLSMLVLLAFQIQQAQATICPFNEVKSNFDSIKQALDSGDTTEALNQWEIINEVYIKMAEEKD